MRSKSRTSKKDWDELVQYAHSGRGPRDPWQQGSPTMGGFDAKAREFQGKLTRIAREDMNAAMGVSSPGENNSGTKLVFEESVCWKTERRSEGRSILSSVLRQPA